jgi:hypothetical protein
MIAGRPDTRFYPVSGGARLLLVVVYRPVGVRVMASLPWWTCRWWKWQTRTRLSVLGY